MTTTTSTTTSTIEALPGFFSLLFLDHKITDASNIRIVSDNARSQQLAASVPSLCSSHNGRSTSSHSSSSHCHGINTSVAGSILTTPPHHDGGSRLQAINRWQHDAGYDSDTSLMMFAGGRRKASLEQPTIIPSSSAAAGSKKSVRFQDASAGYDSDLDGEDKWAKPSSDSCLSIPQRKSSLTQNNSLDEQGKQDMFAKFTAAAAAAGRPPRVRLTKSKSPPKHALQQPRWQGRRASMDTTAALSPQSSNSCSTTPLSRRTPSPTFHPSRKQGRRRSMDCSYSPTAATTTSTTTEVVTVSADAPSLPSRSYSDERSSTSLSPKRPVNVPTGKSRSRRRASMDSSLGSSTHSAATNPLPYAATTGSTVSPVSAPLQVPRLVTPPSTPRLKKKSKKSTSPVGSVPQRSNSSGSTSSSGRHSLKYRLPLGYST